MVDPFATALAAQFASSMAVAAIYTPVNGDPVAVRVIRSQGSSDAIPSFGGGQIIHDRDTIEVRLVDVAQPAEGDLIEIAHATGALRFTANEEPMLDTEGMTWRFGIIPVLS